MHSSSIYISSKTAMGNLENFLEAARGKTIVIEDKYRKSTGSIRLGVREKGGDGNSHAQEEAATRQALYQAISTVLESNNRTTTLIHLKTLVQPPANCDSLFIANTTQLRPEVLEKLFQNGAVSQVSQPAYRAATPPHVIDGTLALDDYLLPLGALGDLPTPRDIANNARNGKIETASSNPQFSSIFVKDFERMAKSGAYRLENLDGTPSTCRTLEEFAEFVGPGDQNSFKNGTSLVTVVSSLTSQNLPVFLNIAILKSANTPIKSVTGEPIFFTAKLKSTYDLKRKANGGIMLTYKGSCQPEEIRRLPAHNAPYRTLPNPGLATIECDIIFRPSGDIEYGNVRIHAEGLSV